MNKHKAAVRNANTFKWKTNVIKAQYAQYANRVIRMISLRILSRASLKTTHIMSEMQLKIILWEERETKALFSSCYKSSFYNIPRWQPLVDPSCMGHVHRHKVVSLKPLPTDEMQPAWILLLLLLCAYELIELHTAVEEIFNINIGIMAIANLKQMRNIKFLLYLCKCDCWHWLQWQSNFYQFH